ncbi:TMAO reductase system sensor histidine kinase/response regulator TorS [Vibrio nomapromontoriensis]|uniref:TMAO reductase system sensor histidine kinase/response regulator TorS n=1 Tax=Vibrio nomapromontoriensis TaxID=2910246 RepID=UPI003D139066
MLLAKASIGRKLFFSFAVMALLVLFSTAIGVSGFSLVAKTERKVVEAAMPSMLEAREVSELSTSIIASVQTLSNAKTKLQHQQAGKKLFGQLESLLSHIKTLGSDSFDAELLGQLEQDVQAILDSLIELGMSVERRIELDESIVAKVGNLRVLAQELEELTRTQVLNTSTIAVANVTHIYGLLEKNEQNDALNALDSLVEIDLDLSERLHELHLLAFKTLNQIEESRTVTVLERIEELQSSYQHNITIMKRRVQGVEDPARSKQMTQLLEQLEQGGDVFALMKQTNFEGRHSLALNQETLDQLTSLNKTVAQLVDQSNAATSQAVAQLSSTLNYAQWTLTLLSILSFMIVVVIVWRVVYLSVVKRLAEYSSALLSIAKGQLKVDLAVKGNDELAHMGQAIITARDTAQSLKTVAESEASARKALQEHKAHLEQTIADRTIELQNTNASLNREVKNHAQARNDAEQASRAKTAFLATMSHEIRTPMNGVLGTAALMEETPLDEKQQHYLGVINRSGQNLLAILNDVLDYSKIEAGHLDIRNNPFDLTRMVRDCYQLMHGKALEKQLEFKFSIDVDVQSVYCGDVTRLSQVLNNLVGNAIKFTDEGEVSIHVSRDPDDETCLVFEVSDTGMGISPNDQLALFDAFTQASHGKSASGGTGLGLAISQKLVNAMHGQIYVDSYLGEGSRFWFIVPLETSEFDKQDVYEPIGRADAVSAKVLLVEDNPVNLMVAEGFLVNMGHHVRCAENGADAEVLFTENDFDIALLDINLPDTDGVTLMKNLKSQSTNGDEQIPMIAVSAHVFTEEVEGYLRAGFDGYLPKPIDREALKSLIQSKIRGRELRAAPIPLIEVDMEANMGLKNTTMVDEQVLEQDVKVLGVTRMTKIVDAFTSSSQVTLEELERAAQQGEAKRVKDLAHKLKGSAGALGLTTLFEHCLTIEKSQDPIGDYIRLVDHIVSVKAQSVAVLNNILVRLTR